jgi:hypothetical protein
MERINAGSSRWLFLHDVIGDEAEIPHELVMQLQEDRRSLVGMYYYYIRVRNASPMLCRIPAGQGSPQVEEVLDHMRLGISDGDLEENVRNMHVIQVRDREGYYQLSPHIERKIRVLLEIT